MKLPRVQARAESLGNACALSVSESGALRNEQCRIDSTICEALLEDRNNQDLGSIRE